MLTTPIPQICTIELYPFLILTFSIVACSALWHCKKKLLGIMRWGQIFVKENISSSKVNNLQFRIYCLKWKKKLLKDSYDWIEIEIEFLLMRMKILQFSEKKKFQRRNTSELHRKAIF